MSHQKIIERIRNVENYTGVGSDNTSGNTLLDDIKEVLKEDRNNNISNPVEMNNYLYDMVEKGRCYVIQDFHNDLISKFKSLNNHMDPFRNYDAWKKFCYTFRNELEHIMNDINVEVPCINGSANNITDVPPHRSSFGYEPPVTKRRLFKEYYSGRITYDKLYADFGSLGTTTFTVRRTYTSSQYQNENFKLDIALLLRIDMIYYLHSCTKRVHPRLLSSLIKIKNCRYLFSSGYYNFSVNEYIVNINNTFKSSDYNFKNLINDFKTPTSSSKYVQIVPLGAVSTPAETCIGYGYEEFSMIDISDTSSKYYSSIFQIQNGIMTSMNDLTPPINGSIELGNGLDISIGDAAIKIINKFATSYSGSGYFRTIKQFKKSLKEYSEIDLDCNISSPISIDDPYKVDLLYPTVNYTNHTYSGLYYGSWSFSGLLRDITGFNNNKTSLILFLEEDQNPEDVVIEAAYVNDERQIQKFEIKPSNIRKMTVEEYGF